MHFSKSQNTDERTIMQDEELENHTAASLRRTECRQPALSETDSGMSSLWSDLACIRVRGRVRLGDWRQERV